jgi:peptidase E
MRTGGIGGGNTRTGLNLENERDLLTAISHAPGYRVVGPVIYYNDVEVARSYRKHALYVMLLERGVDYRNHLSKKLLPDDAIYVTVNNTMFIIELKFQNIAGSVDEKLQTCDFKKKQYRKLLALLNFEVEYITS